MSGTSATMLKPSNSVSQLKWEDAFESLPGVRRVDEDNWQDLHNRLAGCDAGDSYITSVNYYLFTGRRGLWLYEDVGAFRVVCWHPNIDGQILVFPQMGDTSFDILPELLEQMPVPPNGLHLVRVPQDDAGHITLNETAGSFLVQEETVLDWRFPVHVLSTQLVVDAQGRQFMNIRNCLRQTHKRSIKLMAFDAVQHSRMLENMLHRWASHNATTPEEYENYYSPYESMFAGSMDKARGLNGVMIIVDDVLQAVGLWDISNNQRKTANLFVNISNTAIKGLSELLITKCCEALQAQGIGLLNIGGSETSGLDAYKRKFCPVESIALSTIDVALEKSAPAQIVPLRASHV